MNNDDTLTINDVPIAPSFMEEAPASQALLPEKSASEMSTDVEVSTPVVVHANGASTPVLVTRLRPGLTLGQLSRMTKISKPTLSRLFSRQRKLNIDHATKIARALNCSIDRVVKTINFQ